MSRSAAVASSSGVAAGAGGGSSREGPLPVVFDLTPHKIAICHLIHVFAPPAQSPVPFPFRSIAHHNRLGLFLFSITRSCEDFLESSLDELVNQLKSGDGSVDDWLSEQLISSLSALTSPDDLFNFFDKLRAVLANPEVSTVEDDQIFLDPNSHLGVFVRCCILAFNMLSFEGVCHLLTNLGAYCTSTEAAYDMVEDDDSQDSEFDGLLDDVNLDFQSAGLQKHRLEQEAERGPGPGESSFSQLQAHKSSYILTEDSQITFVPKIQLGDGTPPSGNFVSLLNNNLGGDDGFAILRSRWQIEGYLNMQADLLEKDANSFPLNSFNAILNQIQKLAPELHRVNYLRYLNAMYHDDYIAALDNLHCYFDYSAGMEGLFNRSSSPSSHIEVGRYETALLCLGTLQSRFGHSKKALEVLKEAVQVSQQNNDDSCLAYTLAAICNLLAEVGISDMTGIASSPYALGTTTGLGTPLSAQQQFLVLLKRSLTRADHLKLTSLSAFNHLALAKFDLKHVKRPLLSFGPEASMKLRTCPTAVCKEIRLSSHVLSEYGADGLSLLNDTGAFSTSWLKNTVLAAKPWLKNVQNIRALPLNDYDTFRFDAQPSPLPASVLQLAGASYLLRATSWEHYGSAPLVRMNALVYATCFSDVASSSDLSLAYAKLIQHLAIFKGYTEAFNALKIAEQKFSFTANSPIQLLKLQLLHEHALHRGNLKIAQQICDRVGELASSVSGVDMALKTEAGLRHARTLLAAKQFSQAAAVASNLFSTCYKFNMQIENATILLLLAEIHKKSANSVLGLSYALASMSFCQTFNLDLLEASATLTLAEIWLSLGSSHTKRASNLVQGTLPMILGHGGLELRARANIALAKCHLADPNFSVYEDPQSVLDPLVQAAEALEILEYHEMAMEAFHLMALVYNSLGKLDEREDAAASFRKHVMALENSQKEDANLLV